MQPCRNPLREVRVVSKHRSRRARALKLDRVYSAAEAEDRALGFEDEAPEQVDEREPLVRQLVSTALRHRGWSVLERADGTVALSVAPETLDAHVADYSVPSVLSPSAARKARAVRKLRAAYAREPLPVEELVSAGSSSRD
jgi:CheY-like chemotaxis protein